MGGAQGHQANGGSQDPRQAPSTCRQTQVGEFHRKARLSAQASLWELRAEVFRVLG